MVKARAVSSYSERPCLALAPLRHSRPSSPLSTLLRRPPHACTQPAMEPPLPSSPRCAFALDAQANSDQESLEFCADAEVDAATAPSRRRTGKPARFPSPSPSPAAESDNSSEQSQEEGFTCVRQRLQRHRAQMSGNVIIPETWGREQQLQEWVSHGIVEDALRPAGLTTARTALVRECQRRGRKPVRMPAQAAISADVEVS